MAYQILILNSRYQFDVISMCYSNDFTILHRPRTLTPCQHTFNLFLWTPIWCQERKERKKWNNLWKNFLKSSTSNTILQIIAIFKAYNLWIFYIYSQVQISPLYFYFNRISFKSLLLNRKQFSWMVELLMENWVWKCINNIFVKRKKTY